MMLKDSATRFQAHIWDMTTEDCHRKLTDKHVGNRCSFGRLQLSLDPDYARCAVLSICVYS